MVAFIFFLSPGSDLSQIEFPILEGKRNEAASSHPVSLKGLPQRGLRGNAQFCWFVLLGPSPQDTV